MVLFEMTAQEQQERYVDWPKGVPLPESSDSEDIDWDDRPEQSPVPDVFAELAEPEDPADPEEKAEEPPQTQAALDAEALDAEFNELYGYDPELDSGQESGYESAVSTRSSVGRRVKRRHEGIPLADRAVYVYTPYVSPAPSDSEEEAQEDMIAQQFNTTAPPPIKLIEPDPESEYDEPILPFRPFDAPQGPIPQEITDLDIRGARDLSRDVQRGPPGRRRYPIPESTDSEDESCDYHRRGRRRRFVPPAPAPAPAPPRPRGNNVVGTLFLVAFLLTWATLD